MTETPFSGPCPVRRARRLRDGVCVALVLALAFLLGPGRAMPRSSAPVPVRLVHGPDLPSSAWDGGGPQEALAPPEHRFRTLLRIGGGPFPDPSHTGATADVSAWSQSGDRIPPAAATRARDCRLWGARCGATSSHTTGIPPPPATSEARAAAPWRLAMTRCPALQGGEHDG
jgi:hypothetical protein